MHPFPPSADVQFLTEGEAYITQVVLNATTMAFQLENQCRIDVGGALAYVDEAGVRTDYESEWFREGPIRFHVLLGKRLIDVQTDHLTMTVMFENDARLIVHSDLSPYEAGAVLGPNNAGFYF